MGPEELPSLPNEEKGDEANLLEREFKGILGVVEIVKENRLAIHRHGDDILTTGAHITAKGELRGLALHFDLTKRSARVGGNGDLPIVGREGQLAVAAPLAARNALFQVRHRRVALARDAVINNNVALGATDCDLIEYRSYFL